MVSANDAEIRLGQLTWPISYQFMIDTPFGPTQQELTVEAPFLSGNVAASARLGPILWQTSVATATTRSCRLVAIQMMCWKTHLVPVFLPPLQVNGLANGSSSSRQETGVIVMHSGHLDAPGRRRLFVPGMPSHWAQNGVLTKDGAEGLQELGRGMIVGFAAAAGAWELQWLMMYPRMFPTMGFPQEQVGFRFVNHLRVCLFTERAPDPPGTLWPG